MDFSPIICFGQQPCGFFPKRFLVAKINTARRLQEEIGGKVVFFYHDSDADYRETITIMKDRQSGTEVRLNFLQENKIQKKYSPLYAKRITPSLALPHQGGGKGGSRWKKGILKQLPRFVDQPLIDLFASTDEKTVADFCLKMYEKIGLIKGMEILRSSDKNFRQKAMDLQRFYADVEYQDEVVRAKMENDQLVLYEGGGKYLKLPMPLKIEKWQKSAGRDDRFAWMQSVIHCTHYILGESEKKYLDIKNFPEIKFINRDYIDNPEYAWTHII